MKMLLTELKQIIREEIESVLVESPQMSANVERYLKQATEGLSKVEFDELLAALLAQRGEGE